MQVVYNPAFQRDPILSQALTVIRMHFCPLEEMCELDSTVYSREKGTVPMKLPSDQLKMFPPLFDTVDFDISL